MYRRLIAAIFLLSSLLATANEPVFPVEYDEPLPNAKATFEEALKLIREQYYTEISEEALYEAAIRGMLRRISPPESPELGKLWKPADYDPVKQKLLGVQVSIGIRSTFNPTDGSLTVSSVTAKGPSDGILKPLDRIMKIDGTALLGKDTGTVSSMLKGEPDTTVKLTVVRGLEILGLEVTRRETPIENIVVNLLSDTIAHIEVRHCASGISKKLDENLKNLREMEIRKIALDLRGNTGGVLMEALRMAELFLPNKSIMLRTIARDDVKRYVSSNKAPHEFQIVAIVDHNTASAAEILVAALRDHGKASVVGTATYGKSVIEKTHTLENEYRIKFILNSMTSPRNVAWQDRGLLPDYRAETGNNSLATLRALDPGKRLKHDVPLNTAWKLLKR
jgi:carboxyl-terminal processing protease